MPYEDSDALVDTLWESTLATIKERGWAAAERELAHRVSTQAATRGVADSSVAATSLVLGTLQQKFGNLPAAKVSLERTGAAADPKISTDGRLRLAKVYAQESDFHGAVRELEAILVERGNTAREPSSNTTLAPIWRLGFALGVVGETRASRYWFDRHLDRTSGQHGSQLSNNRVFRNLALTRPGLIEHDAVHVDNIEAVNGYLAGGLSVDGVKFLNISKSVVVPLLIEAWVLISLGDRYSGLVQVLLCRRLLLYEDISVRSEGISEALFSLGRAGDSDLVTGTMARAGVLETDLLDWLEPRVGRSVAIRAIDEVEARFEEFLRARDYRLLAVRWDGLRATNWQPPATTCCFEWAGHSETGLGVRMFLVETLGLRLIGVSDAPFSGLTRAEALMRIGDTVAGALLGVGPATDLSLGVLLEKLGPARVVLLRESGEYDPWRAALAAITVDRETPAASFDAIRRAVETRILR